MGNHSETNPSCSVMIKDRRSLNITGFQEVEAYANSEIKLRTSQGKIVISGKDLCVSHLIECEIEIQGLIKQLSFPED